MGLILGAFVAARWRPAMDDQVGPLPARLWGAIVIAALLMGYSARLAFGCNVGALFSGIATGSLHGWVWFAAAFAGSAVGLRLHRRLAAA